MARFNKGLKLYVTDNEDIAAVIKSKHRLKYSYNEALWHNSEDPQITYELLYIDDDSPLSDGSISRKPYMSRVQNNYGFTPFIIVDAFEPTPQGRNNYELFREYATSDEVIWQHVDTRTSGLTQLGMVPKADPGKKLITWTKTVVNFAVTKELKRRGINVDYDIFSFPFIYGIEKKVKEIEQNTCFDVKVSATFKVGGMIVSGYMVDESGKQCVLSEEDANLLLDADFDKAEVVDVNETEVIINPPGPFSYLQFVEELLASGIRISKIDECLYDFYKDGVITFPKTTARMIAEDFKGKIASAGALAFLDYKEAAEDIMYLDKRVNIFAESEYFSAITLLDVNIKKAFETVKKEEHYKVLDALIRRQLAIQAGPSKEVQTVLRIKAGEKFFEIKLNTLLVEGWKSTGGEKEEAIQSFHIGQESCIIQINAEPAMNFSFDDANSILKQMRLNAIGSDDVKMNVINAIEKSKYIKKIHNYYFVSRRYADTLSQVPAELKQITFLEDILAVLRKAEKKEITENEYKRLIIRKITEL